MSRKTKTTTMKEETKPALVPKLRFPEFLEAWKPEKLETLGYFTGGGTPSKENEAYWTGEIPWISSSDLTEDSISQINVSRFITKEAVQESATKLVPAKSILLISRVGVGKLAVSAFPLCTSQDFTNFTPTAADPLFLAYLLKSRKETLLSLNQGTSIKGFTKDNIASLELGLPSPAEQQKIAECLSSVDELMAAQARKVDALKTHKKGLMQQLFPREGEIQPRLRFPEFQNAEEWNDGELGPKASKVGSGITPTGGDKNYKQVGRPFVRSQNVGWGILLLDDVAYIDEETHASFNSTEIQVRDVLLNITGASIGRSAVADERIAGGNVNQHVCIIRTKPDELNPFFLNQYLISQRGQKQIDSFQAGGNRQGLNFSQIRSFAVPLPPTLPEQQRIASCLSSLDALITAETQKLEALKTHKRGLMQQLFPSPERVAA
jgi:type I restriction enzyme, S subunit